MDIQAPACAAGDRAFYGKSHSWGVWGSLLLIALSAAAGGAFDLQFDAAGYAWQLLNWRAMPPSLGCLVLGNAGVHHHPLASGRPRLHRRHAWSSATAAALILNTLVTHG